MNSPVVLSPLGPKKRSVARASWEFSSWLSFCWLVSQLPSHQTVRSSHTWSTAAKQGASSPSWHEAPVCETTANAHLGAGSVKGSWSLICQSCKQDLQGAGFDTKHLEVDKELFCCTSGLQIKPASREKASGYETAWSQPG